MRFKWVGLMLLVGVATSAAAAATEDCERPREVLELTLAEVTVDGEPVEASAWEGVEVTMEPASSGEPGGDAESTVGNQFLVSFQRDSLVLTEVYE